MRENESMNKNAEQMSDSKNCAELTEDGCVTEEMRTLLQDLANLANQASDEVYDDDDADHGTAGILRLCDVLVAKIDTYLER